MSVAVLDLTRALTGLSTDSKPTNVAQGTLFYETDTRSYFIFDGSSWVPFYGA